MRDALLRRNEVEALMWEDVSMGPDGSGRPTVARPTKTDQEAAEPHTAFLTRATVAALTRLWTAVSYSRHAALRALRAPDIPAQTRCRALEITVRAGYLCA